MTDASNAARTSLFDIHVQAWDAELLDLFGVPRQLLPEVVDSAGSVGDTESALLGGPIAITGIAGDQQAAMFGQAAFEPGMMKSTYGTGCFVLLNTGSEPVTSRNRLLTTIAWRLNGVPTYALEGSIFVAGAAIQWLRDGLGILDSAAESQRLAESVEGAGGVYMVPAFVGLGAPYWDPNARGALLGLTRDTGRAHIVRAALEAVAFQTRDLLEAMSADGAATPAAVRVDGGLAANDWAMQKLADTLDIPIVRPLVTETTALGAAYLAGLGAGVYSSLSEVAANWRQDHRWEPGADPGERARAYAGWRAAVDRVLTT